MQNPFRPGKLIFLMALFFCVIPSVGAAQSYLLNRADFPIGTDPVWIASGDFNRDGKLDLAIADTEEGSISVLLARANGTFTNRIVYTGFSPGGVATGDFNRDGKLDLAVTNSSTNTVSILLGNGDGTFQAPMDFPTSLQPCQIVVADFNHDGKLDVVVTHNAGNSISVLLGNGNGTLQGYVDYSVPGPSIGIVAADFNRDSKVDLAVATATGVSIFLGKGDGTFGPATNFPAGQWPVELALGDFNRDGFVDLVVSNGPDCGCGYVSVLLGNGDGTFRAPSTMNLPAPGGQIVAGDFNRDHKPDFSVISNGLLYVFLGNGDGTFKAPALFGSDQSAETIATGDFNRDGIIDLAVGNFNGNNATTVSVLLGNGDGTFGRNAAYATGQRPYGVATADFNGDGRKDIATLNVNDNTVSILLGGPGGVFQPAVSYPVGNVGQQGAITVGDFNGDGKPDIAVTNFAAGTVSVLLNLGNGTFSGHADYAVGTDPESLVAGDFNGDGKLDLVVGNMGSGLAILLGKGDGTFQNAVSFAGGLSPMWIAAADFNHDGNIDLATVNGTSSVVSVLLGNGKGGFTAPVTYNTAAGLAAEAVIAADVNTDSYADLEVATSGGVSVLLNNGNGTFKTHVDYVLPGIAISMQAADITGDGKLDLVVSMAYNDPKVAVLVGNGNGTFRPYADYFAGQDPAGLAVVDFNKDGSGDIATTNLSPSTITVTFNTAAIALFPASIKFSSQVVGTVSSAKLETISNPGSAALRFTAAITITGTDAADFHETNTCGANLPVQTSCQVSITFQPTAVGTRTAKLLIADTALGQQQAVALTGSGK